MFLIRERIARLNIFKTNHGTNVTGFEAVYLVLLVGVHLEDAGNALLVVRAIIQDVRT